MKLSRVAALWALSTLLAPQAYPTNIIGIITKTNTNRDFVKMRESAEVKAAQIGLELRSFAGKFDGDRQVEAGAIKPAEHTGERHVAA